MFAALVAVVPFSTAVLHNLVIAQLLHLQLTPLRIEEVQSVELMTRDYFGFVFQRVKV